MVLLSILTELARYGYIGDVTKVKERTMMMAILASLGLVLMPLGDFVGGQIYKAGLTLPSNITFY